ncbi:IS3 family transposase [Photorhabdus luminescens]
MKSIGYISRYCYDHYRIKYKLKSLSPVKYRTQILMIE